MVPTIMRELQPILIVEYFGLQIFCGVNGLRGPWRDGQIIGDAA
jgi:hypothetical protein